MRKFSRALASLLCIVMLLGMLPIGAMAADIGPGEARDPSKYTDIKNHWAKEAISNVLRNGVMFGTTDTTASPDKYITRAEMSALMVRAFEAKKGSDIKVFVDMNTDQWHYEYVSRAVQMGIVSGNGNSMRPYGKITKQEAAVIFCRAFNLFGYSANLYQYADSSSIASFAWDSMAACVGAGVISANNGYLYPTKELTRAEFASMLYHLVQYYVNSVVPFKGGNVNGSMLVSVSNITLNNTYVTGNMYLADGVGNGTITLDNVQVAGSIYVRGASKVILKNNSRADAVVVFNPSYAVAVSTDESSYINRSVIDTAISTITLSGNVGNVKMNTGKAILALKEAEVGTLNADVILPTITVDKNTRIDTMNISRAATGAKVTVDGTVKYTNINADSCTFTANQDSDVGTVSINCDESTLKFNGKAKKITLEDGAEDNTLTVAATAKVGNVKIDSEENNNIDIGGKNSGGSITVDEPKDDREIGIKVDTYRISSKAKNSEYTFVEGAKIDNVIVEADNIDIYIDDDASIKTITVYGNNCTIDGDEKVGEVILRRGAYGAKITTPNTKVTNNSGYSASVGGIRLETGDTVTTDNYGYAEIKNNNNNNNNNKPTTPTTPSAKDSVLALRYAVDAEPRDLYTTGAYQLSDFVLGGGYNDATSTITGQVRPVEDFSPMMNSASDTKYYFPLVLTSNDIQDGFTISVLDKLYTKSNVSTGYKYKGQLVFFVPLDPNLTPAADGKKLVEIRYDADGNGTAYNPVTRYIDFSNVNFTFETNEQLRLSLASGAPGIAGAEGTKVLHASSLNGILQLELYADNVVATKNSKDVTGNWAGVKLVGPSEAFYADYTVSANGETKSYSVQATNAFINNENYHTITHYEDAASVRSMTITVTWKNAAKTKIGLPETYVVDLNQVGVTTSESVVSGDIAEAIVVTAYDEIALGEDWGRSVTDFAMGYNVANSSDMAYIAGTYNKVMFTSEEGKTNGFYVPLSIQLIGITADCKLCYGDSVLKEINLSDGADQTVNVLVPLKVLGPNVSSFILKVVDKATTNAKRTLTKGVNASQAAADTVNVIVSAMPALSETAIYGVTYADMVTEYNEVMRHGNDYTIDGDFKSTTLNSSAPIGNKNGHWIPARISNITDAGVNWKVVVTFGPDGRTESLTYNVDRANNFVDIVFPASQKSGSTFTTLSPVTVTVSNITGAGAVEIANFRLDAFASNLEGIEPTPVVPEGD